MMVSDKIRNISNIITGYAIVRLIAWEILEHDFNVAYNPIPYPLFSILWLYYKIGKKLTIQIKNGKMIN